MLLLTETPTAAERESALAETLTALKAEKALQAKQPGH